MEENNNNENKIVEKGKQVAKDAVKNVAKETMKKILPAILPAIGWFVLIILAMGLINLVTYMITSWFTSIFHPKKADTAGEDEVKSVISINQYGGYDINTDNFAEQVLKELENKHVSTELMGYTDDESEDSKNEEDSATTEKEQEKEQEKLKKDLNSMIDKYVKAEVQTMYPRTGRYGDVDGLITIKKMSAETGKTKTLTYITYDEFNNRNDSALCNCFSLEPETFKLWIATETKTEYYMYNGTDEGSKVDTKSNINKISYDYKTSVQGYGIPFNFLISLHNTVQDKKFMKEVLKQILDKNEPIILTFVESSAKTTILKEYDGRQWVEVTTTMKPPKDAPHNVITEPLESDEDEKDISDSNIKDFSNYLEEDYYWKKVTTTNSGSWVVTKADTLLKKIERTIEITNRPENPGEPQTQEIVNKSERLPDEEDDISIKKKIKRTIINETTTVSSQNSYFTIVDSVKKLNVDEFIDLIKKYPKAENNLTSAPSNFIYLLQQNEDTQQLEQIMRYVLFKLTGEDYGVTKEEDLEYLLSDSNYNYVSVGRLLKQYIRYWENGSGAPTNEDGTKYIIETDGAGHPTVGYGVDIENCGYKNLFIEKGYPTEVGGEVDIEFVDSIEDMVRQDKTEELEAYMLGIKLTKNQKNALISRAYNCGTYGAVGELRGSPQMNFVDSYNAYWKEEDNKYEEKVTIGDFSHKLYTQYMSKPVTSDGDYLAGLERRRKSEWILFQTGYYDVLGKWEVESTAELVLAGCEEVMNDLLNHNVQYSLTNLTQGDIKAASDFSRYDCCCCTYVSVVLYKTGILEEEDINPYNYNWCPTTKDMLNNAVKIGKATKILNVNDAQPGDVCVYDDHAFIYAGDNEVWDQRSGCISSEGNPPERGTYSGWSTYKYEPTLEIWRMK